jgi:hypothetical protein
MGSTVQQRKFTFEFQDDEQDEVIVGNEMQYRSKHVKDQKPRRTSSESCAVNQLGGSSIEAMAKSCKQSQQQNERNVACASMFRSELATEAFNKLTSRQQEYLTVYLHTLSPTRTAQELGLRSTKNVSKEIKRIAKLCGFESVSAMKHDAGVDDKKENKTSATSRELMQLIEQQGYCCALTGKKLTPQTARLDHKVSVCDGGLHDVDNLHWVLDIVNTAKGTMSVDQFVSMCIDVARWSQL